MKNRFSLSPRLALRTAWFSGSLGLAMLIASGIYMFEDQQLLEASVSFSIEEVRLGNSFPIEISLHRLAIDNQSPTDFYFQLPEDLEANFVPSSLRILNGSLDEARVLPYSGKKSLEIKDFKGDSLQLEVRVQVSADIVFAERSFPFAYGVKVNQGILPLQKENDQFTIKYVPLQLKHRLLSTTYAPHNLARYELLVHNPSQGTNYEKENGLINLDIITQTSDVIIQNIRLNGQTCPLSKANSNQLNLKGLNLPSGSSLLLHYELSFPEGITDSNLITDASTYVLGSPIKQNISASREATALVLGQLRMLENDKGSQITWQTLGETNLKGFFVEQSSDGITFDRLDFIPQQNSVFDLQDYSCPISSPNQGNTYIRVGQEQLSGQVQYSEILNHHSFGDHPYAISFTETDQLAQIQVAIPQQLRVEIRNKLGHTLAVVFDGVLEAGVPYSLDMSMSEFSEGDYLFWMEGEYFKSRRWFIRRRGKWRRFG